MSVQGALQNQWQDYHSRVPRFGKGPRLNAPEPELRIPEMSLTSCELER